MDKNYQIINLENNPEYKEAFIALPFRLYKDDYKWLPPSRGSVYDLITNKHPSSQFLKQNSFLVSYREKIIGRATGFINTHYLNAELPGEKNPIGSIGLFDCENNALAAKLLFESVSIWLKKNGIKTVWAPMNGTIWNSYRLMLKGFEDYPFVNEPYNKTYYPDLFEAADFILFKNWYSGVYSDEGLNCDMQSLEKVYYQLCYSGYTFRNFNPERFGDDFDLLYRLIMDSYSHFTGFHKIDYLTFKGLFWDFYKTALVPGLIHFILNPEGKEAGFNIIMPDLNKAYHHLIKGSNSLMAKLKCLFYKNKNFQHNILYLGLTQAEIGKKIGAGKALVYKGIKGLQQLNIKKIGIALIADDSYVRRYMKYIPLNPHLYGLYKKEL